MDLSLVLGESTYQNAIIHLQHRWGNGPVVTSGQCTALSPVRVNCSNGAGSGGGQNRRYRLRIKLDSGSYFYTFAGTDVISYERPSITSVATKNSLYLDTTFDEITLTGENFATDDYPVSLRFGPVSHPNIYSIGEADCWVSLDHTEIKCNATNIIPDSGLNRTKLQFNVSLAGQHNSKVTDVSFHRPTLKVAFSKINYRSCSPNANLSPSLELCKSFAQMLNRNFDYSTNASSHCYLNGVYVTYGKASGVNTCLYAESPQYNTTGNETLYIFGRHFGGISSLSSSVSLVYGPSSNVNIYTGKKCEVIVKNQVVKCTTEAAKAGYKRDAFSAYIEIMDQSAQQNC